MILRIIALIFSENSTYLLVILLRISLNVLLWSPSSIDPIHE